MEKEITGVKQRYTRVSDDERGVVRNSRMSSELPAQHKLKQLKKDGHASPVCGQLCIFGGF
jgi:hypothetical protein